MFGKRLRKLRKEQNLTQKQIADKLGVNRATVAGYETKGMEPGYNTLNKLAEMFNVSADYLLGRTNQRQPYDNDEKIDKIKEALSEDQDLLEFWDELHNREDLKLMFKQTKDLSPESIKRVIEVIKIFEEEERERHGG